VHKEEFTMLATSPHLRSAWLVAIFAAALTALPQLRAEAIPTQQAAASALHNKNFRDVRVEVSNGVATLSGSVNLYFDKLQAEKKVAKATGLSTISDQITVASTVSDEKLASKLSEQLATDRIGYGLGNTFNAIGVSVENGVVTVGGHVRTPNDLDSAMALITTTPGVKAVNGKIQVDPVSPMDDRLRIRLARAIYGYAPLNRYAIDPAKPIRISVQNGHVTLYGAVSSAADKQMAYMQANAVPGVFSVRNELAVSR